ncbi:MAG: hypothetical protein N4J56_004874 [Chroococcidiopsis sp. SAG 2025]|nr:hypothetical protein [Chroococcidiopsis sp. SAG 2025]
MYTRFLRWATDRIKDGIICLITNSSFLDARAFDGLRKCIQNEFSLLILLTWEVMLEQFQEKWNIYF